MSFVEGMCGRRVGVLTVCGGVLLETHFWTMRDGLCGGVLAWIAKEGRAGVGIGAGLVCGYLAGAIDAMFNYKEK